MGRRRRLGSKDHLDQSTTIPQIDEDDAAVIPPSVNPASQYQLLADQPGGHRPAGMRSAQGSEPLELRGKRGHESRPVRERCIDVRFQISWPAGRWLRRV